MKRRYDLEVSTIEAMCIKLKIGQEKVLLFVIYCPPNSGVSLQTDLHDSINNAIEINVNVNNIILTEDFNSDCSTINGNKLEEHCEILDVKIIVNEPTRITSSSDMVVDQFLTINLNFIDNEKVIPPISTNDHCSIVLNDKNFKNHRTKNFKCGMQQFKSYNFENCKSCQVIADFSYIRDGCDLHEFVLKFTECICENYAGKKICGKGVKI